MENLVKWKKVANSKITDSSNALNNKVRYHFVFTFMLLHCRKNNQANKCLWNGDYPMGSFNVHTFTTGKSGITIRKLHLILDQGKLGKNYANKSRIKYIKVPDW